MLQIDQPNYGVRREEELVPRLYGEWFRLLVEVFRSVVLQPTYRRLAGYDERVRVGRTLVMQHFAGLYDQWKERVEHTGSEGSLTAVLNNQYIDSGGLVLADDMIAVEDILPTGEWLMVYTECSTYADRHVIIRTEILDYGTTWNVDVSDLNVGVPTVCDEEAILRPTFAFKVIMPSAVYDEKMEAVLKTAGIYRLAGRTATAEKKQGLGVLPSL